MDKMAIYNAVSFVPDEAKKPITGGKLNGMTDINPMWRIRKLTEVFGACGIGWKTSQPEFRFVNVANDEVIVFCDLCLQYVDAESGVWSSPVWGTGGSKLVSKTKNGLDNSDEALKMAYTDALSVCCKMIGVGASVYWAKGETKYTGDSKPSTDEKQVEQPCVCSLCNLPILPATFGGKIKAPDYIAKYTESKYGKKLCADCATKLAAAKNGNDSN